MEQGGKFTFGEFEYEIDLIGPRMTLLSRDDGMWQLVNTDELRHFLEAVK